MSDRDLVSEASGRFKINLLLFEILMILGSEVTEANDGLDLVMAEGDIKKTHGSGCLIFEFGV